MRLFLRFHRIGAQGPGSGKRGSGFALGLLVLVLCLVAGCRHDPPEEALRKTIAGMEAAAEKGDADTLFDSIAADFGGNQGMDREAFRRYVLVMGLRNESPNVQLGPLDVKLYGDRASVAFTAGLTGGPGWLPDRAQVYDVTTGWRMQDGEWMLVSASWKPQL